MDVVRIPKEKTESVWILVKEYIRNALIYSGSHHHTDHYKDLNKRRQVTALDYLGW